MSGTYRASIVGVSRCTSPSIGSIALGERQLEVVQDLECLIAHHDHDARLDDRDLLGDPGDARRPRHGSGSVSGHFTQSVPKTTIGSIASRLKLFISALPARP